MEESKTAELSQNEKNNSAQLIQDELIKELRKQGMSEERIKEILVTYKKDINAIQESSQWKLEDLDSDINKEYHKRRKKYVKKERITATIPNKFNIFDRNEIKISHPTKIKPNEWAISYRSPVKNWEWLKELFKTNNEWIIYISSWELSKLKDNLWDWTNIIELLFNEEDGRLYYIKFIVYITWDEVMFTDIKQDWWLTEKQWREMM